jgi:hypothetical protein
MTDTVESEEEQRTFDYFSNAGPRLWYRSAKEWNWDSGTWLPEWIVGQEGCTQETAQIIFWACDPAYYLPLNGKDDLEKWGGVSKAPFNLIKLILKNWISGLYKSNKFDLPDQHAHLFAENKKPYITDLGKVFYPGQDGYASRQNPPHMFEEYRKIEAKCDSALLPWQVPDDLGAVIASICPRIGEFRLSEGIPDDLD